ncbi:hypothetical protein [Moorena producens]|nr:hypothetical protein [Moorena producens]
MTSVETARPVTHHRVKLPTPDSRLPTPDSLLPTPYSLFPFLYNEK